MANIKGRRALGIPLWFVIVGLVIGVALGSLERLAAYLDNSDNRPTGGLATSSRHDAGNQAGVQTTPENGTANLITESTPIERGVQVRAADGLIFEPARIKGEFVGYRVITNNIDPRINVGDIVTEVNGVFVENSAAGGELFIAALTDPYADLTLYGHDRIGEDGTDE